MLQVETFIMDLQTVAMLVIISLSFGYAEQAFELEAEDYLPSNASSSIIDRDTASNGHAVRMTASQNAMLKFDFCLDMESDLEVKNIFYSNDGVGGEDVFIVIINWEKIGTFQTQRGNKWNNYVSTEKIRGIRLQSGRHHLVLQLTQSDKFGVEIDKVTVTISEASIDKQVFLCSVFCFNDISYEHIKSRNIIPDARIEQLSKTTQCAEIDNIKIPFFHNYAKSYEIRAMHPKYKTYINTREPDWKNCAIGKETLWRFDNITIKMDKAEELRNEFAILTFFPTANSYVKIVFFDLQEPEQAEQIYMDSKIGSILTVELQDSLSEPITLGFSYLGHKEEKYTFKPTSLTFTLEIPHFTWSDGPNNSVKIIIPNNFNEALNIKTVNLRKRPQKEEQAFDYYDDGDVVIQGVDLDFWWQYNKNMTVTINDKIFSNANYIRVYKKVPWTHDQYGQTMVIYQDGMVRLLPITPSGTDWIPYGSSVLIGESDPRHHRPSASIKTIDINVKNMSMNILYENGNKAKLHMRSSFSETILTISDVTYKNREENSFLTFMSMWVANGNSDVDHVSVNGNMTHRITDWTELYGTSFVFYRKCISKHNTMSPDIWVEVLE